MNCEKCNVREFVHADLYCRGCPDKPKQKIKTGRAYLFKKGALVPVHSAEVELTDGVEYESAVAELMKQLRIEFVEAG